MLVSFSRARRINNVSNRHLFFFFYLFSFWLFCPQLVVPHHGAVYRRRSARSPCRNMTEHSGSSPRSAKSSSSSSLIGSNADSTSAWYPAAIIGLSRTVGVVVSISPSHPISSAVVIMDSSPPSSANLSSSSGSVSGSTGSSVTGSGSGFFVGLVLFLEAGQGWLWSEE